MPEYNLAAVPAHKDHGPTVVGDLPCTGCGYNLLGVPLATVCPECGLDVRHTISPIGSLTARDWRAVGSGIRLVLVMNTVDAASLACGWFVESSSPETRWPLIPLAVILAMAGFARAKGYTRLASAAPNTAGDSFPNRSRQHLALWAHLRAWIGGAAVPPIIATCLVQSGPDSWLLTALVGTLTGLWFVLALLQYGSTIQVLTTIGRAPPTTSLARLPERAHIAIMVFALPGALLFGIGIPLSMLCYNALLTRFMLEARRQLRSASPPTPPASMPA